MTEQQLQAIKERASKATPGPWKVENSRYEGRFNAASVDENYDLPACLMGIEDAEFVAHARQDIPALIAELEQYKELYQICEKGMFKANAMYKESNELNEQLEEILHAIHDFAEGYAEFNPAFEKVRKMAKEGLYEGD